jgi:hypothetical protein
VLRPGLSQTLADALADRVFRVRAQLIAGGRLVLGNDRLPIPRHRLLQARRDGGRAP